jgi:antitoxin (DNA-binding transcriptional repressor) of toxin-antitoxin stability system
MQIDLLEARALLPQLIDRTIAGEEIIILQAGRPVVRMLPAEGVAPSEGEDAESEIAEFFADALGG